MGRGSRRGLRGRQAAAVHGSGGSSGSGASGSSGGSSRQRQQQQPAGALAPPCLSRSLSPRPLLAPVGRRRPRACHLQAPAELVLRAAQPFNFCIIDEVDSILIDEARTPLIISGTSDKPSDKYYKARCVPGLPRTALQYIALHALHV